VPLLTLPPIPIGVHTAFEMLAMAVGMQCYRKQSRGLGASDHRFLFFAAAILGAAIGCKVPVFFENLPVFQNAWMNPSLWPKVTVGFLASGKSIFGAIFGAWVCIEIAKKSVGHTEPTGDSFAFALLVAIIIGRIGCFLCGLPDGTFGIETALPWGIDFGDGLARHPLQLYEILWLVAVFLVIRGWERTGYYKRGDRFQWFIVGYATYRFWADFLKPETMTYGGLTTIQILSVFGLFATLPFLWRFVRSGWSILRQAF
jgi:phosphatidylglycerol---prolipoprotein diacylglyceryl transferase